PTARAASRAPTPPPTLCRARNAETTRSPRGDARIRGTRPFQLMRELAAPKDSFVSETVALRMTFPRQGPRQRLITVDSLFVAQITADGLCMREEGILPAH